MSDDNQHQSNQPSKPNTAYVLDAGKYIAVVNRTTVKPSEKREDRMMATIFFEVVANERGPYRNITKKTYSFAGSINATFKKDMRNFFGDEEIKTLAELVVTLLCHLTRFFLPNSSDWVKSPP